MVEVEQPRFAIEQEDAERRYAEYRSVDPFAQIPPALLNSADISDYVAATGMICPFYPKYLKPASYGVRLKGKVVLWGSDAKQTKRTFILSKEPMPEYKGLDHVSEIRVPSNSIAFVSLEPKLRLPNYLAGRFNLRIKQVYRGFLLGTGPLVDPGFCGRLSFPLHNLTDNAYTLFADEEFIWLEFTKVSYNPIWTLSSDIPQKGEFVEFETYKAVERLDVDDYLKHANNGAPIASSIPRAVEQSRDEARRARKTLQGIGFAGFSAAVIAILLGIWGWFEITAGVTSLLIDGRRELNELRQSQPSALSAQVKHLRVQVGREIENLDKKTKHATQSNMDEIVRVRQVLERVQSQLDTLEERVSLLPSRKKN